MTPTKTPAGGISYTRGDSVPDQKPTIPNTPRARENVEKGNQPHAPAEPLNSAADSRKR